MKRLIVALIVLLSLTVPIVQAAPTTWYVSRLGNNAGGTSWATAWNELNQINWVNVMPGDTILIAGGTYATAMTVGKSGTAAAPINVQATGMVVIFGGRTIPLPECDVTGYTDQSALAHPFGIDFNGQSYITVDGTAWSGIYIHGTNRSGVHMSGSHNVLRNAEITDNGQTWHPAGNLNVWRSDQPGVLISGTDNTFDRDLIHDNGQDAFQGSGPVGNITITNSWLYNGRAHSSSASLAFNYCMHSDGFQVYTGGTQSGISFTRSILGPGMMQGSILGQSGAGGTALVNNVSFTNVLILDTTNANIMGYPAVKSSGWHMDHVTSFHTAYDPDAGSHWALYLEGAGNSLSNSIFYGGGVYTPDGLVTSGNIQFNVAAGVNVGPNQDPAFASSPPYGGQTTLAQLIAGDYSSPSGKGSSLTSVSALMGAAAPTSTAVPPTSTGTAVPTTATSTGTSTTVPPTVTSTGTATGTATLTAPTATATATATASQTQTPTDTPTASATALPSVSPTPWPMPPGCVRYAVVTATGHTLWDCP